MRRRRWPLLLALALLPFAGRTAEAGDPVSGRDVYVRGTRDIPQTIERISTDPAVATAGAVVFAFEAASFSPPPGRTEFVAFHGFHGDVPAWVHALVLEARKPLHFKLFAATSLHDDAIDLSTPAATRTLTDALSYRWAKDERARPFRPAAAWMADVVRSARRLAKAERVVLVYVADRVQPERAFEHAGDAHQEREWRRKLTEDGEAFDEEAVGRKLASLDATLFVVAPEAHFEDFTPLAELPLFPWAARPEVLTWPGLDPDPPELEPPPEPGGTPPFGPPPGGVPPMPPGGGMTDEEIEEFLRGLPPDVPEEVKRGLRESLRRLRDLPGLPLLPGGPPPGPPDAEDPPDVPTTEPDVPLPPPFPRSNRLGGRGRFGATTPTWFPTIGWRTPWANHAPSAYGHWPYARAAALTGGRYLFYPFPEGKWLDVCPTAGPQVADLAPELVKRSEFARVGAGDAAWNALDRVARMLLEDTPWTDAHYQGQRGDGWSAFAGRTPVLLVKDWILRRKPLDDATPRYEAEIERMGRRLVGEVVPLFGRALRTLDEQIAALRRPGAAPVHPRALADLTLGRYWVAMSRFHLHALGLYATEIERFRPDDPDEQVDHYVITYVPAIKMSDVLDAYDGRTLPPEAEAMYGRGAFSAVFEGEQDNILDIPETEPDYRARRDQARVLVNLDDRLRDDALDMIEAARAVMARYSHTGWGWTTYYSVAYTFVWYPVPPSRGAVGPLGGAVPSTPPEEPTTPSTPGGGSTGGGPTTGR
jgi:hypothetical protein